MGRPPTPWLDLAYTLLKDGEWLPRDVVLEAMVKMVPPGVAHRRGAAMDRGNPRVTHEELVRRGARHICLNALSGRDRIQQTTRAGMVLVRLEDAAPRPVPLVFWTVPEGHATHVVVPTGIWRGEDAIEDEELSWVRQS